MYIFKKINDPTNTTIDSTYQLEQEKDLFQVGKLFTLSNMCFSKTIEPMLGNPNGGDNTLGPCINCPNCNASTKSQNSTNFSSSSFSLKFCFN
jgi:hypothetical protein